MKILFAASEATPFIKTGGLADVAGSLPLALRALGHDVRLVLPGYPAVMEQVDRAKTIADLSITGAPGLVHLLAARAPRSEIPLYIVDAPGLLDRPGNPYADTDGKDYADNAQRFATFSRVVVSLALGHGAGTWRPEVVHCNDWQTGLTASLLTLEWKRPATVFTIHNLAYQGLFDRGTFQRLGLPERLWGAGGLEFHDQLSFIKGGIGFSDVITTVSPTYAKEILGSEFGYGLEGLLGHRTDRLHGVLNGIDQKVWDPATDANIAARYSVDDLRPKSLNKLALQKEFGLPQDPSALLFAHIGRLVDQKGADLILEVLPKMLESTETQLVILGSGDPELEDAVREAAAAHPSRVGARIGYDEKLAHLIEAGSDVFLMPSRFEPCGLNQLYSLRYGTVPIVRRTGGLADSVVDAENVALMRGEATGFVFDETTPDALWSAIDRAIQFRRRPGIFWDKLMRAGMTQDFSWRTRAERYLELYRFAIENPASIAST